MLLPVLAAGLYASSLRARTWWPLWLLAAGSASPYCIAATPTGVRRSIPLAFVASLLLGELFDRALSSRQIPRLAAWVLALAVLSSLGYQTLATARAYRDGSITLPHDFDWIAPDMKTLLGQEDLDPSASGCWRSQPIRAMCFLSS